MQSWLSRGRPTTALYGGLYTLLGAEIVGLAYASETGLAILFSGGEIPECSFDGEVIYGLCAPIAISHGSPKEVGSTIQVNRPTPIDPNFISGPTGFGASGFLTPDQTLPYFIDFENKPTATAPAQVVVVTQQLDPNLDWTTFQLGNFGFGDTVISVPAGRNYYTTRIDDRATSGVFIDVTAGINLTTGLATWNFTSIDPETLDIPGDPLVGFLPPDVTTPQGVGFVTYTVGNRSSLPTGAAVNAKATVVFNTNAPLDTNTILNTIDAGPPTSTVAPLPTFSVPTFTVNWSGADDAGGSGISTFDVFDSDNGRPFQPLLTDTLLTSTTFTGTVGHTYGFYSVATDNVGNRQPTPTAAQASVTAIVVGTTIAVQSSETPSNPGDTVTFSATVTPALGTIAPTGSVQFTIDSIPFGSPVPLVNGSATSVPNTTLTPGNHTVTAVYTNVDGLFNSGTGTLAGGQVVNSSIVESTTTLSASSTTPVYGQSLSFTAMVTPVSGTGTPTGTVQFMLDGTAFGSAVALAGGTATSPSISTLSALGHSVTANYAGDSRFSMSRSTPFAVTVAKAPLTVTADAQSQVYGQVNPTFTASDSGFVLGQSAAILGGALSFSTTATAGSDVGTYPVMPAGLDSDNYAFRYAAGTLTITPASQTIAWPTPADIVSGSAPGSAQLDAVVSVPGPDQTTGTVTYSPAAGTQLNAGMAQTLTVFVAATSNYNAATESVTINVLPPVSTPPTAANDSYSVTKNKKLSIASPGLLANDTFPKDAHLTVTLVSGTRHGKLTLSANGSFVYTPKHNFKGTDQFTYTASDGTLRSGPATVLLTIGRPPAKKPHVRSSEAAPSIQSAGQDVRVIDRALDRLTDRPRPLQRIESLEEASLNIIAGEIRRASPNTTSAR